MLNLYKSITMLLIIMVMVEHRFFMLKNIFVSLFSSLILFLLIITPAFADNTYGTSCTPIYGGGTTCAQVGNISINKTVAKPTVQNPTSSSDYVQNLDINSSKYSPGQQINFQITVTNTSTSTLNSIIVKDMFPATVTFVAGPGSFDTTTQTLTYTLSNVQPNESRTDTIRGKIVSLDKLPSDQAIKCDVNQATAGQTGQEASVSNAQFCIQKQLSQF